MLSKSCGYAIRGILYLALKTPEARKIGIQELAESLDVPMHFMGKIMQGLVRRDIVNSTKGPNGGFYLRETTFDIPVINIVEAVDGLGAFRRCILNLPDCSNSNPCPLHNELTNYRETLYRILCRRTVHDLVSEVQSGRAQLRGGSLSGLL